MDQTPLDVSIVIPLWNGKQDIEACLESVYRQRGVSFEVIVVDNASSDGSPDLVAQNFPQVRLILNAANLGFSGGVNTGLRSAQGAVMVLLNQDTEVLPHWLNALVEAAREPLAGIIGSKALYPDGSIQHAGGKVDVRGACHHIGQWQVDDGRWDTELDCDFVTGASIAITREAYNLLGGLDEGFAPAYFEDVDFCYNVRDAGFTVRYIPQSQLIHKEKSAGFNPDIKGILAFHKNRIRFILKHWAVDAFSTNFVQAETAWLETILNPDVLSAHIHLYRAYLASLYAVENLLSTRYAPYSPAWSEYIMGLNRLAIHTTELISGKYEAYVASQSSRNRRVFAAAPVKNAYRPEISFVPLDCTVPKRVLVISPNFPPVGYLGGAEISCYHTTKGLMSRGVDAHVLSINAREKEDSEEHYAYDGIPVHRITLETSRRTAVKDIIDGRVYRAVRRELQQLQPDIVHVHNASGSSLASFVASERENTPIVCTLHDLWLLCPNNMLYKSDGSFCDPTNGPDSCHQCFRKFEYWGDVPKRRQVFRYLTRNTRAFMTPSQALMNRHLEAGYDPRRFAPVRLGFAERNSTPPIHPGVLRLISDQRKPVPTILFTGGGSEIKGAGVLAHALKLLFAHIPALKVVVAGGGDAYYLNQMRALSPMVTVIGRIPFTDMRHLMNLADLVLVPSVCHENSPVTIFEAYQTGTPVIGSDFGGLPENIDEWETGYTFPVRRYDIMAARIIEHFARPVVERRQMRSNCLRKVRTELNLDQHIDATLSVYMRALGM